SRIRLRSRIPAPTFDPGSTHCSASRGPIESATQNELPSAGTGLIGIRGALVVALVVASAASARADIVERERPSARAPRVQLAMVTAEAAPDAPGGDIARVQSDVHG